MSKEKQAKTQKIPILLYNINKNPLYEVEVLAQEGDNIIFLMAGTIFDNTTSAFFAKCGNLFYDSLRKTWWRGGSINISIQLRKEKKITDIETIQKEGMSGDKHIGYVL